MVKMTIGATTTALVGKHFEITGSITKTYYYAGAARIATREGRTVWWLFSDHLGSTAVTARGDGYREADLRYYAYGLTRLKAGTQKTPYRYTGQRIEAGIDLYYYGARWYDPVVGRFLQADTIVPNPGNPQSLNRYTYVGNNPLRYTDPTGHWEVEEDPEDRPSYEEQTANWLYQQYGVVMLGNWSGPEAAAVRGGFVATDTRVTASAGPGALRYLLGGKRGPWLVRAGPASEWAKNVIISITGQDLYRSFARPGEAALNYVVFLSRVTSDMVIHELGHIVDYVAGQRAPDAAASLFSCAPVCLHEVPSTQIPVAAFGASYSLSLMPGYSLASSPTAYGQDHNRGEDFAESWTAWVMGPYHYWGQLGPRGQPLGNLRTAFIEALVVSARQP
jgi:RHS repeat-associated protein